MRNHVVAGVSVTFYVANEKKPDSPSMHVIGTAGAGIAHAELVALCEAVCRRVQGKLPESQKRSLYDFVKPLLLFLQTPKVRWPGSSSEWQIFLLNFLRFYLLNREFSGASTETRIDHWMRRVTVELEFLKAEQLLPPDVAIPECKQKKEDVAASERPLLGDQKRRGAAIEEPLRKTLPVTYNSSDPEFLELIENAYRAKVDVLRRVCLEHWQAMKHDHAAGDAMTSTIPEKEVRSALRESVRRRKNKLTCPSSRQGLEWSLALAKEMLRAGTDVDCISTQTLRASPLFDRDLTRQLRQHKVRLAKLTAMPADVFEQIDATYQFYRFVGIFNGIDIAVAVALLQMEHPNFNPMSIQNARLLNARGRYHLLTSEGKDGILSVDKPRAGTRKYAVLTPLAQEIIAYIAKRTEPVRRLMRLSRGSAWRFLFPGFNRGGRLGPNHVASTEYLTGVRYCSLTRLYPDLERNDLRHGTLDYERIRNTMGLLRWFETGSIREMSRALGNSYGVVLEHYIPPVLLHAWNVRQIRRFQQTLILLALHDESFLLDVSDFSTLSDLVAFVGRVVLEYPAGTSPIADRINSTLTELVPFSAKPLKAGRGSGVLHLRLRPSSLGLLYVFSDWAARLPEPARAQQDSSTGYSAQQFIDLARMLRHACENEQVSSGLGETLDIASLRRCHDATVAARETYKAQFEKFTVIKSWGAA